MNSLSDIQAWVEPGMNEDVDEPHRALPIQMEENDDLYQLGFNSVDGYVDSLSPDQDAFFDWCDRHVTFLFGMTMINKVDAELIKAHWSEAS